MKRLKKISLFSTICCIINIVLYAIQRVGFSNIDVEDIYDKMHSTLDIYSIVMLCVLSLGLVVSLFFENKYVILGFFIVNTIQQFIFIRYFFLTVIPFIVLSVLLILNIKKKNICKKIWFIPGVIGSISLLFVCILTFGHSISLRILFGGVCLYVFEAIFAFLLGLWIKEEMISRSDEAVNEFEIFDPKVLDGIFYN